mmetsp:Transcript_79303/g.164643  ORF Transcript_79303/g.164643 Transcript_79303/m.164643 type:complete len:207 (+) Transcript_79303:837-1457(+)
MTLRWSTPPKLTSDSSSCSPSVRKMPNWACGRFLPSSISKKLNSEESARPSRPRPKMPSKRKVLKGWEDISTARMTLISTHSSEWFEAFEDDNRCSPATATASLLNFSPAAAAESKQTMSFVNSPVISPVPKPMVTWSHSSPSGTSVPSELIALDVVEADMLNFCRPGTRQASDWHSAAGSTRWPEPVSKTTRNSCAGVPRLSTPE